MRARFIVNVVILNAVLLIAASESFAEKSVKLAKEIVNSAGINAGLCVHLGCGDGALTAELAQGGKYLVHGLALDKESLAKARKTIQAKGLYGPVSVERCSLKQLPYAENIVNLVVVDDLNAALKAGLSLKEVMRALCPNGVAYIGDKSGALKDSELKAALKKAGIKDFKIVKRSGIWGRIQKPRPAGIDDWTHWRYGPDGNMVSKDMAVGIPARLKWVAGPTWARMHVYFRDGSCNKVGDLRAMVSEGGRVFCARDAAPRGMEGPTRMVLIARDAFSGVMLWERPIESVFPLSQPGKGSKFLFYQPGKSKWSKYKFYWYRRRSLAATGGQVYTVLKQNGPLLAIDGASGEITKTYDKAGSPYEVICYKDSLVLVESRKEDRGYGYGPICCLDAATGKLKWKNDKVVGRYLAVADEKVFCETKTEFVCLDVADGSEKWRKKKPEGAKNIAFYQEEKLFVKGGGKGDLYAISARDGSLLWSYQYKDFSRYSDTDVYYVDGLVWAQVKGERWAMVGLDPATGTEKKRIDFPEKYPKSRGHHRCHPNKATGRYFLLDTAGLDFVDRQAKKVYDVRTYRANCYVGLLPANGLLYLPPNVCQCGHYYRGFVALAPARKDKPEELKTKADGQFEKGLAFGKAVKKRETTAQDEWPCYRADPERSGSSSTEVPSDLKLLWEKKVSGNITAPTVAEGMVFVASKDAHQVRAFDAGTGEPRWSYMAGGRVDTPPTIYAGLALFGCRNGWVYCLRAKDGELVWRFRAAPREQRIVAFGQLESSWPVNGSVLVHNGTAFFSAGRFSELDGGVYVYAADPASGKIIWKQKTSAYLDEILKGTVTKGYPTVYINDILIAHGNFVSIHTTGFDAKTGAITNPEYSLWTRSGMLDEDSWTGRMRWRRRGVLTAELMVFNSKKTCAILTSASNKLAINPGKSEYKLFGRVGREWEHQLPLRVRAMVLAGSTLFVAGIPDVVDEKDYWAAFDGKRGSELLAFSASDGKKLPPLKLESVPAFDGMAAAGGKLYLATKDGKLICFGGKE